MVSLGLPLPDHLAWISDRLPVQRRHPLLRPGMPTLAAVSFSRLRPGLVVLTPLSAKIPIHPHVVDVISEANRPNISLHLLLQRDHVVI